MGSQGRGQPSKQRGQQIESRQIWGAFSSNPSIWTKALGAREEAKGEETEEIGRGQIMRILESQPYVFGLNHCGSLVSEQAHTTSTTV